MVFFFFNVFYFISTLLKYNCFEEYWFWRSQADSMVIASYQTCHQNDLSSLTMTLITQLETVFVCSLHCEVKLSFSPLYTVVFGKKSLCMDHTSGVGVMFFLLEATWSTLKNCFEFLSLFWMNLSHVSYLFSHLFISVWIHGYFFDVLGYNSMLLYFTAQLVPALAIGSSFSRLLCLFDTLPSIVNVCVYVCVHIFLSTFWI